MEKPSETISAKPEPLPSPAIISNASSPPRWAYFDNAMKDFHAGQYKKALPVFQNILGQKEVGQPWHELAERRIADCMYFLNTETDAGTLYLLVNQYNRLLLKYPDIRSENDIIYWRLGHLYKSLRNYGQADNAYKKLLSLYHESPFAEEALYQTGDILRIDKQYAAATTVLKTFYVKYPNSPLSRSAIFSLADSYYNMGLSKEAELWYSTALQRWPDLYGLPEDIFLNVGYHFYSTGNYAKAFQILSYFRNLYPKSRFTPSITRAIAQCLVKMNQTTAAVRFLGTALDKEKDLKESIRIRMMLVEMGFTNPKAKTSFCFSSSESYRNPIWGSNQMLIDLKNDPLAEEVLYQKGRLLETANRSPEAYDAYSELLQRYPGSRYLRNAQASVEKIKTNLINDNYQKQDYLAVANLYFLE
jgi:TolA-binding protein